VKIAVDATYENGVLKPDQPLALSEKERVRLIIHAGPSRASQNAGLIKWTGSTEDLEYFAQELQGTFHLLTFSVN
jgi:predicted DNA-binding antitoxin AbrB/MazE fold protein